MTATSNGLTDPSRRKRRGIPAFVCALIGAVLVVAIPIVARHIDGSADEFSTRNVPVLPAIGWFVCASLAAVVLTHRLQIWFSVDEGSAIAVAYDVLPLVLFLAPVIAVAALVTGHLLLGLTGAVLTAYHAVLVVPRLVSARMPAWARSAPRFRLAVANVYVDNPTPQLAARQLIRSGADVIVIAEATPPFIGHFDAAGGRESYPHRVFDPADTSDYAVAIASRLPLAEQSAMRTIGALRLAVAEVKIDGIVTTIATLNPRSTFDAQGQEIWKEQIEALRTFVPTVSGPLVIAGDLNSTGFRPEFEELLQGGLEDAIDSLGQAWKPSFSLKSVWPLGALGHVARIDQALVNDQIRALRVRNLKPRGSDHVPFVITLAVRRHDASLAPSEATATGNVDRRRDPGVVERPVRATD
jgi:endonuclease/exonuclease/phosphatase (EEP) superfamily protein YafD